MSGQQLVRLFRTDSSLAADLCIFISMPPPRLKTVPEAFCVRVCPSVSESVCESVRPENLVNNISKKSMKGTLHNFGHRCDQTS